MFNQFKNSYFRPISSDEKKTLSPYLQPFLKNQEIYLYRLLGTGRSIYKICDAAGYFTAHLEKLHLDTPAHQPLFPTNLVDNKQLDVNLPATYMIQAEPGVILSLEVAGVPLETDNVFHQQYANILQDFAHLHRRNQLVQWTGFWRKLTLQVEMMEQSYYGYLLQKALHKIQDLIGQRAIPFHYAHGNFSAWNAGIHDNQVTLFDWRNAYLEAPAGLDILHFFAHREQFIRRSSIYDFNQLFHENSEACTALCDHLDSLDFSRDIVNSLILLYLTEQVSSMVLNTEQDIAILRYLSAALGFVMEQVSGAA